MTIQPTPAAASGHHARLTEVAPGVWDVARPLPSSSPLARWVERYRCRRDYGHCWHPEALIDWWCCMCPAETDGMPPQRCAICTDRSTDG